jgi:hypothetical protein
MLNLALKQEFFDRKLSATLQVRDLLASGKHESVSEGLDFYRYSKFTREAPIVMLNLSLNINNYQPERKRDSEQPEVEGMDEF